MAYSVELAAGVDRELDKLDVPVRKHILRAWGNRRRGLPFVALQENRPIMIVGRCG